MVNIINNCIDKNVSPTAWRVARVCPIPKIDNPIDFTKYRPISVLCILSKVFERVILTQLCKCNYIDVKASYNLTQSGFRKGNSTSTFLMKLTDNINRAMYTSEGRLGILLHFPKAFDTIDHFTLLQKLYKLDFPIEALKLIQSYISEPRQYVQVDDRNSSTQHNNFGVPQCSILVLVFFNLYIVDIIGDISCNTLQYADDATLYQYCKLKNLQNCIEKLESDLQTVSD